MTVRAEEMLRSPLGRQFVSRQIIADHDLFAVLDLDPFPRIGIGRALFGPLRGYRRYTFDDMPKPWLDLAGGDVVTAYRSAVENGAWRESLRTLDEVELLAELEHETYSFSFNANDYVVWHLAEVAKDELLPAAEAIVEHPAAAWWWDPLERSDQRFVAWNDEPDPSLLDLSEVASNWLDEEDLTWDVWWSKPSIAQRSWTTRRLADVPAISLANFYDSVTDHGADATVWSFAVRSDARVYEVTGPDDWRDLVQHYPYPLPGARRDWDRWTGGTKSWLVPDWSQVAEDFDGVHVTVGACLSTWGSAVPVIGGHSMISGWMPDSTIWLDNVLENRRFVVSKEGVGWVTLSHWRQPPGHEEDVPREPRGQSPPST